MRFHLIIGTKDADIAYWMDHLPKGSFSHYVVAILNAEIKKKIAVLPIPNEIGLLERSTNATIYFNSKSIEEFIAKIGKGKKGNYIKKIIRKHLEVNYRKAASKKELGGAEVIANETKEIEKVDIQTAETVSVQQKGVNTETIANAANDFRTKMMRMTNR